MSNVVAFVPKDNQELPDAYGIKIFYIDGKSEDFEVASHNLGDKVFEFVSKDDIWSWVQISNIKRIEFDKRFSKIVAIKKAGK